jgi:myotubularin-related protein 6/7/8
MVGLTNARSIQDEKIVESIFSSHKAPDSRVSQPVFGATSTNLIIDARPTTNAVANTAKGAGTENMDHYKECKKAYLGIDNIHTMRDSLNKVIDALGESEALAASVSGDLPGTNVAVVPVDRQALRRSGWLRHQVAILEGTLIIVRNVHVNHSHVLIHCSDGWDRTSQLSAVSQLCLDPYYRTTRGFQVLIEKDFVSFGHRFLDRCGHLSSEKFFLAPVDGGGGADVAQALFASVQNRFAGNHHIKETSPVFHQFLEAVHNIQRQFPARFEFNELLLRDLHTHLYSCQFGTFLFNSERDRREGVANTVSVWDYINSEPQAEKYINPEYNPALDDPASRAPNADQGVLFPNPKDVRFWHELYGRSDEEMNGRFAAVPAPLPAFTSGVIESLEDDLALPDASISLSSSGPPSRAASTPPPALSSSPAPVLSPVPARVPSPLALGPRVARPPPTDLFVSASGGVRSMWDRLSSGAGAAFSAVQDAYGTTATTTRDTRSRSSSALVASGELQDWGAAARPHPPSRDSTLRASRRPSGQARSPARAARRAQLRARRTPGRWRRVRRCRRGVRMVFPRCWSTIRGTLRDARLPRVASRTLLAWMNWPLRFPAQIVLMWAALTPPCLLTHRWRCLHRHPIYIQQIRGTRWWCHQPALLARRRSCLRLRRGRKWTLWVLGYGSKRFIFLTAFIRCLVPTVG